MTKICFLQRGSVTSPLFYFAKLSAPDGTREADWEELANRWNVSPPVGVDFYNIIFVDDANTKVQIQSTIDYSTGSLNTAILAQFKARYPATTSYTFSYFIPKQ